MKDELSNILPSSDWSTKSGAVWPMILFDIKSHHTSSKWPMRDALVLRYERLCSLGTIRIGLVFHIDSILINCNLFSDYLSSKKFVEPIDEHFRRYFVGSCICGRPVVGLHLGCRVLVLKSICLHFA